MNINIKRQLFSLVLAGTTIVLSTGCTKKVVEVETKSTDITYELETDNVELKSFSNNEQQAIDKDSVEYNTRKEDIVFIKNTTNIYLDKDAESEKVGKILEGRSFRYLDEDDEWYQIDYYGIHGYISKADGMKTTKDVMKYPAIGKGYLVEKSKIYADPELTYELDTLPELEFLEIHRDLDNSYLAVTTYGEIGYVPKEENIKMIEGDMAVVDKSDEEVLIYEDDVNILRYPAVTGCIKNGTISDSGCFDIFHKRGRCSFSGVTVDFMLNYNAGEGIHDAFRWRKMEEFGGDTYINNGSHGCINSPQYIIPLVYSTLDVGEKVLVKE